MNLFKSDESTPQASDSATKTAEVESSIGEAGESAKLPVGETAKAAKAKEEAYRVDSFQTRSAAWVPTLGY